MDGSTLRCSDAAKSPSDTGCQHLLRPLRRKKRNPKIVASLLVGNWDLRIEEYISAPYRPAQTRGKPCPARHSRLRVSWLTDAKLRTPRLDVAGDWKGDCARFIRCRLSVMEVYNMLFFFFLVRSGMQRVLPQPKKKKKPVRTLGNHEHSAGVHEKEIREMDGKKER